MIEEVRLESDERGFLLVLGGDFVEETRRYIDDPDESELRLRLPQDAALALLAAAESEIGPWRAEMREARAEQAWRVVVDPAESYDPDDPKHPTYHDRMSAIWDEREGK